MATSSHYSIFLMEGRFGAMGAWRNNPGEHTSPLLLDTLLPCKPTGWGRLCPAVHERSELRRRRQPVAGGRSEPLADGMASDSEPGGWRPAGMRPKGKALFKNAQSYAKPFTYLLAGWLALFSFTACGQEQPVKARAIAPKTDNPDYRRSLLDYNKKDSSWYVVEHLPTRKVGVEHVERGMVIPPSYDMAFELGGNRWLVMSRGIQKAIFDTLGNQLTPFENNYEVIASSQHNPDLAVVYQNGQRFLLSLADRKPVTGERYAQIFEMDNGFLCLVQTDTGLFALGAPNGKRLTDFVYPYIERHEASQEKTAQKLGGLRAGHHVAAFAWLDPGFVCLDDEGKEVPCIER